MTFYSVSCLREEDTVAFPPNLSKDGCRSICWIRDECEIFPFRRPLDSCLVLNVVPDEGILLIANLNSPLHAMPIHVEGDLRRYRGTTLQRVHNIVVVLDIFVTDVHLSYRLVEIDNYAVI